MKKIFALISLLLTSVIGNAQKVYDGKPADSTTFTLEIADSLNHNFYGPYIIDTSNTHLWKIAKTTKPFFIAGSEDTTFAIMTDTTNPYYANADDWFVLKFNMNTNMIIDFTHKYQTAKGHDGGIVEYSQDSGKTWENVKGICNQDSFIHRPGIHTQNFYSDTDTLISGQKAFSGTSDTFIVSRLQFFFGFPLRITKGSGCDFWSSWPRQTYLRFRFISDSTPDTLAGWIIDNIKIEFDDYGSIVPKVAGYNSLSISPNPSNTGIFYFPELTNEKNTQLEITNTLGQVLTIAPYSHTIDLSQYSKGLYLYKVVNSEEYYSGRLIVQ